MTEKKQYETRDPIAQGHHYTKHINAMTSEGLHNKTEIVKRPILPV